MKRHILMSLILLIVSTTIAQEVYKDEYFIINTAHDQNKSYHYIAQDSILLTDGFSYKATDGNMMSLIIDPMTTTLPMEGITGGPFAGDDGVVGTIGGSVNVGALGAAVYTIPIEVPAGINGMQPQLAITYNSQAGNGLLGWGWNLSGISAITRTGKTIYHDKTEFAYPVDFKDDRFLLDGQRLLKVDEIDYGGDQCKYRTEIDNISKIVSEVQNNVTSNFDVWTKGGLKIEYGNTNNSKIKLKNNNDTICMWLVNKVTDLNGNYMTYEYITNETSYRLDKIKYAGNGNIEPEYTIQFNYEERDDVELRFVHNRLIEEKYLLKSIDIKYENDILYSYSFDYDNINANAGRYYKRLLYVNLEKDDMKLNPTRIEWGTSSDVYDDTRILNTEFNSISYVGDFNGDGYDDIFSVPYTSDADNFNDNDELFCKTFYNNKNGGFTDGSQIVYKKSNGFNLDGAYPCDLNGDGLCDMILHSAKLSDSKVYSQNHMIVYIANENSFVYKGVYNIIYENNTNNKIFVGDFLGNGKSDILVIYDIEGVSYYKLSSFENDKMQTIIDKTQMPIGFAEKKNIGDFNGDGKMDLLMTNGNISKIYTINKDGYNYPLEKLYESGFPTKHHEIFTGDFNGDGKTDLLTWAEGASPKWQISISKSDGFYYDQFYISNDNGFPTADPGEQVAKLNNSEPIELVGYRLNIGDVNCDGKSDIVFVNTDVIKVFYTPLILTKSNKSYCRFIDTYSHYIGADFLYLQTLPENSFLGNFYGKSNAVLWLRRIFSETEYHLIDLGKRECQNWVTSITDGIGNKFSFEYDYLSNPDFCHTYPGMVSSRDMVKKITVPLRALRTLSTTNVSENVMETEYKYQNLYYHSKGRGILGFEKTSVTDITNNIKTVNKTRYASINRLSVPYLLLDSCMTYITNDNNNALIRLIDFDYVFSTGTQVVSQMFPLSIQLNKQIERNYDMNGEYLNSVITTYEYDNMSSGSETFYGYGNIKTIKKGIADESETSHFDFCNFKETTNIVYETPLYVDQWIVDRKKKVVSTLSLNKEQSASGIDDNIIQCVSYEYNTSKPHLVSSVKNYSNNNLNDSLMTEVKYSYTFNGNFISSITETLSAPNNNNAIGRSTVTQYSSDYNYKFPTKTTNALGYETTTEYDEAFGWEISETDANGLSTIIDNDFFGINSCVTTADGLESATALRWSDGHPDAPANAAYYSWSQNSGEYPALTFYHKTGAELRNVTYGFSGEEIYVDKFYDAKGNLSGESLPYKKSAGIGGVISYSYDELNRLVRTDYPDNSSVTVVYDGNKTTTTFTGKNGGTQSSSKTYHGNGWLKKSVDTGGNAVCNIYNADGTLHSTYIEGFNDTVSFSYNSAGMKTKIDDPDYGVVTYRYNAFGEMISQKNPKNITTSYEYDILGRTVSRSVLNNTNGNEELTAWFYENNANGKKGTLKAILHDNNSVSYQYDNLLRLTSESETFDGMTYNTSYTYDQYGRLNKTTYPSGFVTVNEYNEGGFLCTIKGESNNTLWKAIKYNVWGQITQFVLGNSIVTNKGYDVNTGRITRIYTALGNNIFQDLMYSYDDFGNFASRRKMNSPVISETFTYDNFNRLVSSTKNRVEYRMSYDRYGRILSKEMSDMSFFDARYQSDKPHALKKYTSYTAPPFSNQSVTYTDFDKVETVSMDENTLQFVYGHDHHRRYMTETVDSVTRSKTYIGNCEFVQSATEGNHALTYLYGPSGIYAVVKKVGNSETLCYVHTDHLGSWNVVTDQYRRIVHQYYFDAWGDAKIVDGNGISVNKPMFDRGFTGHEHHYDFGLINMNGRMYDPYTSMFLSPDNYIQAPDNSQSFNRYAYCLNNPLKYTDPDGEFWHIIAGAALGGISNLAFNWNNCDGWQDYVSYFAIGAASGGLGAAVGGYVFSAMPVSGFVGGAVSGAVSGATSGFFNGYGNAMMYGASSSETLKYAFQSSAVGGLIGGITGGLSQGFSDLRSGYSFWDGSKIYEFGIDYTNVVGDVDLLYNIKYERIQNDRYLHNRMKNYYGIEEGDWGIDKITTGSSAGYQVRKDGLYINKDGKIVRGYHRHTSNGVTSELHISPYVTLSDVTNFKITAGHEIIHSYHNLLLNGAIDLKYTEAIAYQYSYMVAKKNNMNDIANGIINFVKSKGWYWEYLSIPNEYSLPWFISF